MPSPLENTELDALFPLPSGPPSALCPAPFPGSSHEATEILTKSLKENHTLWDAYLNDLGFHNHTAHHLLAAYSLGAGPKLIESIYQRHVPTLRAMVTTAEPITRDNCYQHLGELHYYDSYRAFFGAKILRMGPKAVLEEYIFSREANSTNTTTPASTGEKNFETAPPPARMLNRLLAGLVHPFIHAGYGLEFGLPGLLAEGLAQAATHPADGIALVPLSWFETTTTGTDAADRPPCATFPACDASPPERVLKGVAETSTRAGASCGSEHHEHRRRGAGSPGQRLEGGVPVRVSDILGRIASEARFDPGALKLGTETSPLEAFERVVEVHGDELVRLAEEWDAHAAGEGGSGVEGQIVDLFWLNVLVFGVGGWAGRAEGKMNADFFLMHLVTSVVFLPSYAAHLSPGALSLLLRAYLATSLGWYVARGRPALPIADFYASVGARPMPPCSTRSVPPPAVTVAGEGPLEAGSAAPNPWLAIVQSTLVHRDDHAGKLQRALAHCARLLGSTPAGAFAPPVGRDEGAGLAGAERLDGTLFVRVAGLAADRLGWMSEGEGDGGWDRQGFFVPDAGRP